METWTYFPETKTWKDELGVEDIPTEELFTNDIPAAVEHAISVQDGTHT